MAFQNSPMSAHVNPRLTALKASVGIVPKDDQQHTRGNGRSGVDFVKSDGWINIGVPVALTREDGTTEDTFLTVSGMGIEKLKMSPTNSSIPETAQRNAAANAYREYMLSQYAEMQPGEERTISFLSVQIRKVRQNDVSAADPTVNPFMAALLVA